MIYGDAAFMDVPWESLIKQYRKLLGEKSFEHVRDYAADILRYLETLSDLFAEHEAQHFQLTAYNIVGAIRDDIDKSVRIKINSNDEPLSESDIKAIAKEQIKNWQEHSDSIPILPCVGTEFVDELREQYREEINKVIENEVGAFKLDDADLETVASIACRHIASGAGNRTGLVVAGFGETEIFPAVQTIQIHRTVRGKVLYREEKGESFEITISNRAAVLPFAQKDVVFAFLTGCETSYVSMVESMFDEFFKSFPNVTARRVADIVKHRGLNDLPTDHPASAINSGGETTYRVIEFGTLFNPRC